MGCPRDIEETEDHREPESPTAEAIRNLKFNQESCMAYDYLIILQEVFEQQRQRLT